MPICAVPDPRCGTCGRRLNDVDFTCCASCGRSLCPEADRGCTDTHTDNCTSGEAA